MAVKKIGAINIGQAPRNDITDEIKGLLPTDLEVIERGALDGFDEKTINSLDIKHDDYILITKLKNGTQVKIAERHILGPIQEHIKELEILGVSMIVFFCTGEFKVTFESSVPIVFPSNILNGVLGGIENKKRIGVVNPEEDQIPQCSRRWRNLGIDAFVVYGSPYKSMQEIKNAARQLNRPDISVIVLDCIGYTSEMKSIIAEITGKPVILSRTIVARVIAELFF